MPRGGPYISMVVVIYGNCGGNLSVTSLESDFSDGVRLILLTGCLEVTLILVVVILVVIYGNCGGNWPVSSLGTLFFSLGAWR